MHTPQRIAVIGSGISGLAAAWLLSTRHRVTLFEAGGYAGGHSNTVDVEIDGVSHPVDTGFLVFNERTYPNLRALFAHLGVGSVASEMSFAVSLEEPALEWSGSKLGTVFGQSRNLVRPAFWRMLTDILRFNRESLVWLNANPGDLSTPLREFLAAGRYSEAFRDWYLLPMAAAIWSCPTGRMLDYPLVTFVRFCHNHGLLQITDRPLWRTVRGGARSYVAKLLAGIDELRLHSPVRQVRRHAGGIAVVGDGSVDSFDQVVLATHSNQSLALLGHTASAAQRDILGAVRYQPNRALLHTDAALLPRDRSLWSAWNYVSARGGADGAPVGVSYLINRLQPLPFSTPVVVSLNPVREPGAGHCIAEFDYEHPVFDAAAIAAQQRLPTIQGGGGLWFAGAWTGYGFHEDGLRSALAVATALGCPAPWQGIAADADLAELAS